MIASVHIYKGFPSERSEPLKMLCKVVDMRNDNNSSASLGDRKWPGRPPFTVDPSGFAHIEKSISGSLGSSFSTGEKSSKP